MSLSSPNLRFWLLTIGLLALWTVVITSAESQSAKSAMVIVDKEKEQKNARNCKALCEHCGCMGFYCGEECICECNKENSNTECIVTMQKNARKLNIPFELLIQGPTANRFVRNALQYEQNAERREKNRDVRNKRPTVVIYKPTLQNSLADKSPQKPLNQKKLNNMRHKRDVRRLDWFTDLANTLVRPAPIGIHKKAAEPEPVDDQTMLKRSTEKLDSSWFADNTKNLLKPAPLFRTQNNNDDDDDSLESPGEKIPKMLQDTLRRIQDTARSEKFAEAVRSRIKESVDIFQDQLQKNNLNILPNNLGDNIVDTISSVRSNIFRNVIDPQSKPTTVAPTEPPVKYIIPWFRPIRFLQRVHQAIN